MWVIVLRSHKPAVARHRNRHTPFTITHIRRFTIARLLLLPFPSKDSPLTSESRRLTIDVPGRGIPCRQPSSSRDHDQEAAHPADDHEHQRRHHPHVARAEAEARSSRPQRRGPRARRCPPGRLDEPRPGRRGAAHRLRPPGQADHSVAGRRRPQTPSRVRQHHRLVPHRRRHGPPGRDGSAQDVRVRPDRYRQWHRAGGYSRRPRHRLPNSPARRGQHFNAARNANAVLADRSRRRVPRPARGGRRAVHDAAPIRPAGRPPPDRQRPRGDHDGHPAAAGRTATG